MHRKLNFRLQCTEKPWQIGHNMQRSYWPCRRKGLCTAGQLFASPMVVLYVLLFDWLKHLRRHGLIQSCIMLCVKVHVIGVRQRRATPPVRPTFEPNFEAQAIRWTQSGAIINPTRGVTQLLTKLSIEIKLNAETFTEYCGSSSTPSQSR